MLLDITHETRYDYSPEVELSRHLSHLKPLNGPCQSLLDHRIDISPQAQELAQRQDLFGNDVQQWAIHTPHTRLWVTARSRVLTRTANPGYSLQTWEEASHQFEYEAGRACEPHALYTFASRHVPRSPALKHWALQTLQPGLPVLQAGIQLMERIHRDFVYDAQSTHIGTPTLTAFEQRRGVCQDFAHILLGVLRSIGLPARYVSGYLLTLAAPGQIKLIGSDASHAWVSMYVPDAAHSDSGGWYDLDPTNNRHGWGSPGEDYVHLAMGRDYADVSPLRGILQGGTHHTVSVAVTVAPPAPA